MNTPPRNFLAKLLDDIYEAMYKHLVKIIPLVSMGYLVYFIFKFSSLPLQVMQFDLLIFILQMTFFISLLVFLIPCILALIELIVMLLIVLGIKKFTWMNYRVLDYEIEFNFNKAFKRLGTAIVVFLVLLEIVYVIFDRKSFVIDYAVDLYFARVQEPSIEKVMFSKHIIENNKTIEHILYLGEDKSKYYYILDETLNSIIYTDKNLAKEICIGEDDYNGHIKKLVFSNIIDNYMYQRVRKQDMQFLHEYQWFHDSFCKGEYPKFYNEENKTNLLLGTKSRKKYFYSQEQIERVVDNNSSICSLEKKVFLDNLLRNSLFDLEEPNEQEIKTRSQMKWKSVDDNEVVRVFCSVDINSSNLLNLKENKK